MPEQDKAEGRQASACRNQHRKTPLCASRVDLDYVRRTALVGVVIERTAGFGVYVVDPSTACIAIPLAVAVYEEAIVCTIIWSMAEERLQLYFR